MRKRQHSAVYPLRVFFVQIEHTVQRASALMAGLPVNWTPARACSVRIAPNGKRKMTSVSVASACGLGAGTSAPALGLKAR